LHNSSNITLEGETRVVFFFGPRVQIPDDNILIDDEQCFEIGLDCTVKNVDFLVEGRKITYEAFVETDNSVRTRTATISPVVSKKFPYALSMIENIIMILSSIP
jgi:hypothetical protein